MVGGDLLNGVPGDGPPEVDARHVGDGLHRADAGEDGVRVCVELLNGDRGEVGLKRGGWAHDPCPTQTDPSAYTSRFQIGTDSLSCSMIHAQAASDATR